MASCTIEKITLSSFNTLLSRYSSTVPDKLTALDTQRYETIPAALKHRKDEGGGKDVHLQKEEVEQLVEWKLYDPQSNSHSAFRIPLIC